MTFKTEAVLDWKMIAGALQNNWDENSYHPIGYTGDLVVMMYFHNIRDCIISKAALVP